MIESVITYYIAAKLVTAFDYRENSPASLSPFNSASVEKESPGTLTNPAYLPYSRGYYLSFSGSNPYTLEEIVSTNLKIGTSFNNFGIQLAWNRFGIKEYSENIAEANFGYMPIKYISVGIGASYYNLTIQTDSIDLIYNSGDIKFSVLISPLKWFNFSYLQENFISTILADRIDILYPCWSIGAALTPITGLSLNWNIHSTPHGYVNTFSISSKILKYLLINAGYTKETSSYSGSVIISYKHISVSYGLKFHPHLGYTHSVNLSLSTGSLEFESFNYLNKQKHEDNKIKKIDINKCHDNELRNIKIISENFIERIIKYRKEIGPITYKSLYQIGLSGEEINELLNYFTIKNPDKKIKKKINRKKDINSNIRKKELFNELLDAGLKAYSALKLSKLIIEKKKTKTLKFIETLHNIDEEKKKEIKKLCLEKL